MCRMIMHCRVLLRVWGRGRLERRSASEPGVSDVSRWGFAVGEKVAVKKARKERAYERWMGVQLGWLSKG